MVVVNKIILRIRDSLINEKKIEFLKNRLFAFKFSISNCINVSKELKQLSERMP